LTIMPCHSIFLLVVPKKISGCVYSMNEKLDEFRSEVERKHHVRALNLGFSAGVTGEQIEALRRDALWQLSAVFRNAAGTRIFADQQGLSKKHVEEYLRKRCEEERNRGQAKVLEPTFDHHTNKYLTFEEWLDYLIKKWDKLDLGF
jgi:hypothetical protein